MKKAPKITRDPHHDCLVLNIFVLFFFHTLLSCVLVLTINNMDGSFFPRVWSSGGCDPLAASPTGSIRICCCCPETDGLFDLLFLVFELADGGSGVCSERAAWSVEGVEGDCGKEDLLDFSSLSSVGRWSLLVWIGTDPPFTVTSLSWSSSVCSLAKLTNTWRRTTLLVRSNNPCSKT